MRASVKILAVTLAALVAAGSLFAEPKIVGPTSVPVYRMAKLRVAGADAECGFIWDIDNESALDVEEWGAGYLYFTGPPGRYAIKLRVINFTTREVVTLRHAVVIEGAPTPPGPVPPAPTPPVPDGALGLVRVSREGMQSVVSAEKATQAKRLADAQRVHASGVAAGRYADAAAILEGWRVANREVLDAAAQVLWKPWATAVSAKVADLHKGGKLPGNKDWSDAFTEIANGLSVQKDR